MTVTYHVHLVGWQKFFNVRAPWGKCGELGSLPRLGGVWVAVSLIGIQSGSLTVKNGNYFACVVSFWEESFQIINSNHPWVKGLCVCAFFSFLWECIFKTICYFRIKWKLNFKMMCYFKLKIHFGPTVAFWGLCFKGTKALGPENVSPDCGLQHYRAGEVPGPRLGAAQWRSSGANCGPAVLWTSCSWWRFWVGCVAVDVEGCSWYFVRKASSRFTWGARSDVFIKTEQTTVILLTYVSFVCVFMKKEKVWKNAHLTFILILCVPWRSLGRWAGEMITFFFAHLNFLWLGPSWSITFAIKKVP